MNIECWLLLLLGSSLPMHAETIISTGVRYQSRADSPWRDGITAGTIFVDTLETPLAPLNLPGVTSTVGRVGGAGRHGVDEDDGVLDGYGRSYSLTANAPLVFVFSPDDAGEYPKFFGGVEVQTRVGNVGSYIGVDTTDGSTFTFQTIPPEYSSSNSNVADAYGTFFGIYDSRGFREIRVSATYLDHVHVGWQIPEPSTLLVGVALGILGLSRRRSAFTCLK